MYVCMYVQYISYKCTSTFPLPVEYVLHIVSVCYLISPVCMYIHTEYVVEVNLCYAQRLWKFQLTTTPWRYDRESKRPGLSLTLWVKFSLATALFLPTGAPAISLPRETPILLLRKIAPPPRYELWDLHLNQNPLCSDAFEAKEISAFGIDQSQANLSVIT